LARIALVFLAKPERPSEVVDSGGLRSPLEYVRLATTVLLGSPSVPPARDAWIDIGSYITTIPQFAWDVPGVRTQIEWLQPAPGQTVPLLNLGRGQYRFRLGRIVMTAVDLLTKQRLSSPVIAKFTEDRSAPHPLDRILIGMRHGLLDGRRLVLEPDTPLAYLEDR
jgi:hypothetical protein